MKISDFGVEMWMNEFETRCELNLAETCVASLTIEELLTISGRNDAALAELLPMKLTYGAIEGSDRLREAIAGLYAAQTRDNVIVAHGAIGANALVYAALVEPGDHVVSILPTYQQHYSIPESLGATVEKVWLRPENGFLPDLDELRAATRAGTRLIALTNPNNPTGALIGRPMLEEIVDIARSAGAWVLCDEVYRGVDQEGDGFTASIADLYEKGVATAGVSKVFSLAGLRLGWIAAPKEVIERVARHRDYTTISVGMVNDHFAALAIGAKDKILARSREITRTNLAILDEWMTGEPSMTWIRPRSATVTLLKYDFDMPSREFCVRLLERTGVMLTPGAALDMEGYARIGFANNSEVLREGLARLSGFLAELRRA